MTHFPKTLLRVFVALVFVFLMAPLVMVVSTSVSDSQFFRSLRRASP